MNESKAMLEIREIRNKNAEETKNMSIKEKIDYLFQKGENARKNLDLKPKSNNYDYCVSQNDFGMIMEETAEYNNIEKND